MPNYDEVASHVGVNSLIKGNSFNISDVNNKQPRLHPVRTIGIGRLF